MKLKNKKTSLPFLPAILLFSTDGTLSFRLEGEEETSCTEKETEIITQQNSQQERFLRKR